jgi:hypothetical protein
MQTFKQALQQISSQLTQSIQLKTEAANRHTRNVCSATSEVPCISCSLQAARTQQPTVSGSLPTPRVPAALKTCAAVRHCGHTQAQETMPIPPPVPLAHPPGTDLTTSRLPFTRLEQQAGRHDTVLMHIWQDSMAMLSPQPPADPRWQVAPIRAERLAEPWTALHPAMPGCTITQQATQAPHHRPTPQHPVLACQGKEDVKLYTHCNRPMHPHTRWPWERSYKPRGQSVLPSALPCHTKQ